MKRLHQTLREDMPFPAYFKLGLTQDDLLGPVLTKLQLELFYSSFFKM
jgi:hypothetical protein